MNEKNNNKLASQIPEFGEVRTLESLNGEPWFACVQEDVAAALEEVESSPRRSSRKPSVNMLMRRIER